MPNCKKLNLSKNYQQLDSKFEGKRKNILWPVKKGVLLSEFGQTNHKNLPGIKIYNNGIEIGVEKDEVVKSVFEGVVSKILFVEWFKINNYKTWKLFNCIPI